MLKKYATTGDGLLTAIMLTEELCDTKSTLSELASDVKLYPQYVKNIKVRDKKAVMDDLAVLEEIKQIEALIDGRGRALLRQSGTEPVIRVMVEAATLEECESYVDEVIEVIKKQGHAV